MRTRLYVLVNEKLTKSQRIPQACHAVAEFVAEYGQDQDVVDWIKNYKTMVCLQTTEEEIHRIAELWDKENGKYKFFVDSDYPESFGWTAIAFYPITREKGDEYFSYLKLA